MFDVQLEVSLELSKPLRGAPVQRVVGRLRGSFSLPPNTPDELVAKLVPANCLAVLYGILRGFVLQDTGACPGGGFLLPMLDMYQVVERKKDAGIPITGDLVGITSVPPAPRTPRRSPSRGNRGPG